MIVYAILEVICSPFTQPTPFTTILASLLLFFLLYIFQIDVGEQAYLLLNDLLDQPRLSNEAGKDF